MADAFAVLGIFADGDVHLAVVNHRRADDVVARGGRAERVERRLRIAVELPEQLRVAFAVAGGIEAVEPAVAAAEDHLRLAAEHGVAGRRPLAVQDVGAGRLVGPEHLAGVLVEGHEARRVGGGDVVVLDVDAVRRADEEHVAGGGDRAGGHVVLRDAELLHHVEHPNDFGFVVGVAVGVEAADFAAAGDEPEAIAFDERRAAEAFHRPIVNAAGGELLAASAARGICRL